MAPGGKIVRYLEGVTFLPFEVTMALTEAAEGRVGSTTRKVLMYCFSYDPLKKSYVFNILKVTGDCDDPVRGIVFDISADHNEENSNRSS